MMGTHMPCAEHKTVYILLDLARDTITACDRILASLIPVRQAACLLIVTPCIALPCQP